MQPLALTVLPTRKCNLNCAYCKIRNQNFPNELNWKEWVGVLKKVTRQFPSICFTVLLGGDITMWGENLVKFVKKMSKTNISWNFTTNGVLLSEKFLRKLKKNGLESISLSLDSLEKREDMWEDLKGKTTIGLLDILNQLSYKELHCTITVDKTNLEELPTLVKFLTSKNTYAEITPIIYGKNESYDYANSYETLKDRLSTEKDKEKIDEVMKELVEMKKQGYLIHNTDDYLLNWSKFVIRQNWKCEYPVNLVPDADGTMRLCLHIKGEKVRKHNIKNLDFEKFLKDWYDDYKKFCQGCYWNCSYESKYIYEKTNDLDLVRDYFNHKVKNAEAKIKA
jgi:MoaA/NifB/PqqE/SkfB family radical SAM enzyme